MTRRPGARRQRDRAAFAPGRAGGMECVRCAALFGADEQAAMAYHLTTHEPKKKKPAGGES